MEDGAKYYVSLKCPLHVSSSSPYNFLSCPYLTMLSNLCAFLQVTEAVVMTHSRSHSIDHMSLS